MSMVTSGKCPICLNVNGTECCIGRTRIDFDFVDCGYCGNYKIDSDLSSDEISPSLTKYQRSLISHEINKIYKSRMHRNDKNRFFIEKGIPEQIIKEKSLPNISIQISNIICFVGDDYIKSGSPLERIPEDFGAVIGAHDNKSALSLLKKMYDDELIQGIIQNSFIGWQIIDVELTLRGWELYEKYKKGQVTSDYGFIAMQFNDSLLEGLVNNVLKESIKQQTSYKLIDVRDEPEAGVIDNIIRVKIRDSAFVIADLTHDNNGAYWEAGYAEGMGKPVIYICEESKFKIVKTHFDTNHSTTVFWYTKNKDGDKRLDDDNNKNKFVPELIATLRRSLNV